jgi:hypothetical protein
MCVYEKKDKDGFFNNSKKRFHMYYKWDILFVTFAADLYHFYIVM